MWGGGGKKASKGADAPEAAVKPEANDVKMVMDDWPGVEPGERRIPHVYLSTGKRRRPSARERETQGLVYEE